MGNSVTIMNSGGFIFDEWYIGAYIINYFIPNEIRPHSGPKVQMTRTSTTNTFDLVCVITAPSTSYLETEEGSEIPTTRMQVLGERKYFYILGNGTFYMKRRGRK